MSIRGLKGGLLAFASISAISAFSTAHAQQGALLSQTKATVITEFGGAALRGSSQTANIASTLRQQGLNSATVGSVEQTNSFTAPDGKRFVQYEQRINGLRVHGALTKVAFDANGQMVHLIRRLAPADQSVARPRLNDTEALRIAIERNFPEATVPSLTNIQGAIRQFADSSFFYQAPTVERVILANGNSLQEGFMVVSWSADDNMLYHTVVDGLGQIVENELRTAQDQYRVFTNSPDRTPQQVVAGPGNGNAQSPNGWLEGSQRTIEIQGNNVRAYLDRNNNNAPDSGGRTVTNGSFLSGANLSQQPTISQNQEVAVQNLFYFNNIIHDELYRHGFVEGTRNFQENNFGRGGNGSDSVNAEAQDGGSTNNANFATPSDGANPRMQMYIWTLSNPQRDGDVDSDIVWHEYGHGLTWRMIGSMSGSISGAIGEGMSDAIAVIYNNDDALAEYSVNRSRGIRSSAYGSHRDTIGDFNSARGVHRNGEIIGATMWDMWQRYQSAGFSRDNVFDDIVGGMNFIAPRPDYFDMRNGFLAQAPADRDCLIWEAFAERGMGEGGSMNSTGSSINESFQVPAACSGNPPPPPPPANNPPNAVVSSNTTSGNAPLEVNFNGGNSNDSDGQITAFAWDFDGNGTTDSTSVNPSFTYQTPGSFTARLTVTDDDGARDTASIVITVNSAPQTNNPPNAVITASTTSGNAPLQVNFTGSSSNDSDGQVTGYAWDFDGNGSTDSTATNPSFTYQTAGNFTARLTVTDNDGATDTASVVISVDQTTPPPPPPPSGGFEIGAQVQLDVRRAKPRRTPDGRRVRRQLRGAPGVIVAGPATVNGVIWWEIDFDTGGDGWIRESQLELR